MTSTIDFKVEIIPAKVILSDGVNQVRHGTTIEPRPLTGWRYTYYEVIGQDVAMLTVVALVLLSPVTALSLLVTEIVSAMMIGETKS